VGFLTVAKEVIMAAPSDHWRAMRPCRFMGIMIAALLVGTTLGCLKNDLNLVIRWKAIAGLTSGDRVVLDANTVGEVTDVFYTPEGDYRVSISIQHAFANAATTQARFQIIQDPVDQARKAVAITHLGTGGTMLPDGSVIKGTEPPAWSFETFKEDLNRAWDQANRRLKQLTEDLQRLPEDDAVQQLREALQQLLRDLQASGQAARERFKTEVWPLLREELERLREYLRGLGRESEMEPLETVVRDIEAL
jgi:hypothetical protein